MHSYQLETPRLLLRPLTIDDAEAEFVWLSDPVVNRYMPYALYTRVEDVRAWLARAAESADSYHFGFVRKADGLLIGGGDVGPHGENGTWEFGYNLRRDCWNQGYATEATQAMIDFAFREFGVRDITAGHAAANPASGRVMEKVGLVCDHLGEYGRFDGSETFPARFWRLRLDACGRAPKFRFVPMSPEQFRAHLRWRYPAPYEFYNTPEATHESCFSEYLSAPDHWYAALNEQGEWVGFCEGRLLKDTLEIGLGLHPDHTGKGRGEQFLCACLAMLRTRYDWWNRPVSLTVADFNLRAQTVYERCGFRATGAETMLCHGTPVKMIRMVRAQ